MSYLFKIAKEEDMPQVAQLLHNVFRPTYGNILTEEQMQWMLANIFSEEFLTNQQKQENFRFILAYQKNDLLGFVGLEFNCQSAHRCKIHKLYLNRDSQGKGIGKLLVEKAKEEAMDRQQKELFLNVNRHNKARYFYEKMGFSILFEEDIPLENGYFMNDFVMVKKL